MALNPEWTRIGDSRRVFKLAIDRLVLKVENDRHDSLSLTENLLQRLELNWKGYARASAELDSFPMSAATMEIHATEMEEVGRTFDAARRTLRTHIATLTASETTITPRLSEISLPKFAGKRVEWSPWAALVRSTVIETNLPIHDKISVIYAALEGVAKNCVGVPEGRDQGELTRMWDKLQEVYENKYLLSRAHIATFLDLPTLTLASPNKMQVMIDKTQHAIRALSRLGLPADQWDALVCDLLLRKLDPETLKSWEMTREVDSLPELHTLYAFLHKRIQAVLNSRPDSSGPQPSTSSA